MKDKKIITMGSDLYQYQAVIPLYNTGVATLICSRYHMLTGQQTKIKSSDQKKTNNNKSEQNRSLYMS